MLEQGSQCCGLHTKKGASLSPEALRLGCTDTVPSSPVAKPTLDEKSQLQDAGTSSQVTFSLGIMDA